MRRWRVMYSRTFAALSHEPIRVHRQINGSGVGKKEVVLELLKGTTGQCWSDMFSR